MTETMSKSAVLLATAEPSSIQENFKQMLGMINQAISQDPIFFSTNLPGFPDGVFVQDNGGKLIPLMPISLETRFRKAFQWAYDLSDTSTWGWFVEKLEEDVTIPNSQQLFSDHLIKCKTAYDSSGTYLKYEMKLPFRVNMARPNNTKLIITAGIQFSFIVTAKS